MLHQNPVNVLFTNMCLNSLRGKLRQRQNMTQTEYVSVVKRWHQLPLDDTHGISNSILINDNMVQVNFRYKTNMFMTLFRLKFIWQHSQHLMQQCDYVICWTSTVNLSPTKILTALFILIVAKIPLKEAEC